MWRSNGCPGTSWSERVRFAEDLGFDGAWGFDHFQPMFGEGPGETFEGMSTLAALSGLTTDIRLGLLVTGATYRHPSVLAAQALTIDHASHGRLELALGAAWFDKEHEELGIPFPATAERFDLLEDTLEIVTRLFSGEVVSYEGKRISLREAQMLPRPVQLPHPPIWIGGTGPRRTLPLAARYADVWHAFGTPNSLREAGAELDRLATEAGRDPSAILRAGSLSLDDLEAARRHAAKWRDAGYGYLVCGWPGRGRGPDRGVRAGRAPGVRRLMTTITADRLTPTVGALVEGVDARAPALRRDAARMDARGARGTRGARVPGPAPERRRPGRLLQAARDRRGAGDGCAPRDLPGHPRPGAQPGGGLPQGDVPLAHRRLHR